MNINNINFNKFNNINITWKVEITENNKCQVYQIPSINAFIDQYVIIKPHFFVNT